MKKQEWSDILAKLVPHMIVLIVHMNYDEDERYAERLRFFNEKLDTISHNDDGTDFIDDSAIDYLPMIQSLYLDMITENKLAIYKYLIDIMATPSKHFWMESMQTPEYVNGYVSNICRAADLDFEKIKKFIVFA